MAAANPDKLKLLKEVARRETFFSIARSPNSGRVFLGSSDFKVYEVDLAVERPELKEIGAHESYVTGVALAGKTLISGGYDGRLTWWDVDKREKIRTVEAHAKWIRAVAAAPDGALVASVADDMVCRLWEVGSGKLVSQFRGHDEKTPHHFPSMLYACAISPDGKYVATGDKVGHIVVWELASGRQAATLETPVMYTWDPVQRRHSIGGIRSLAFSPDGKLLAVGGIGKISNIDHLDGKARVEVFDWQKGERTHEFPGDKFNGLVEHLTFHPAGEWLLAVGGSGDGFLIFFDLKSKKIMRQEKSAMHIHDVAVNESADTIYAVGHAKIQIFELKG